MTNRVAVSVLVYREGDCWVAVAVYLDLLGVGPSRAAALESLALMVEAQASSTRDRNQPELRLRLAPGGWDLSELEVFEVEIGGEEDRHSHEACFPHVPDEPRCRRRAADGEPRDVSARREAPRGHRAIAGAGAPASPLTDRQSPKRSLR